MTGKETEETLLAANGETGGQLEKNKFQSLKANLAGFALSVSGLIVAGAGLIGFGGSTANLTGSTPMVDGNGLANQLLVDASQKLANLNVPPAALLVGGGLLAAGGVWAFMKARKQAKANEALNAQV